MPNVHPSAVVDPRAKLAEGVEIGPHCAVGPDVELGENVAAGQTIALAGHSGTPDVVHLHFGVYSSYPPVEGDDRAVNFSNMDGPVDCRGGLVDGAAYTAQ